MKLEFAPPPHDRLAEILSEEARTFVEDLHGRFGSRRDALLHARARRTRPAGFREDTREIREAGWQVAPPRADYQDRRVEITGPTDRWDSGSVDESPAPIRVARCDRYSSSS